MADCINYDCNDLLGDHTLNSCGEEYLGGIDAVVFLDCGHQLTDPSSGTQIQAEITAGRATLVKNVKVGMPKASGVEIESNVACSTPKLVNMDRALTYIDGNVNASNISFYNNLSSGRSYGGMILHLCGTAEADAGEKVLWVDAECRFTGSLVVPETNNEFMRVEGDIKWRKKDNPQIYHNPVGIFV